MASASDHLRIWRDFVSSLQQDTLTEDRIQPYHASFPARMTRAFYVPDGGGLVGTGKRRIDMTKARVVYAAPGMERAAVRRGVPYRTADGTALTMDVYTPPGTANDARLPAVVFVFGYSDAAIEAKLGSKLKDVEQYVCWGCLAAASGLIAATYEAAQPESDIHAVLAYVRENAVALGIDAGRIGLWACSGNVPVALAALMAEPVRCAVLYYGYMLDWPGSRIVAQAAEQVGFANPCTVDAFDALPRDVPLLVVKSGRDGERLNETIDRFVREARSRNVPLTLVDYAEGRHAFDIVDDTERSRQIIRQTLAFLRAQLLVEGESARSYPFATLRVLARETPGKESEGSGG